MTVKPGFSFIEVITSVLISSIIGIVLFQSLSQFSKAANFVNNVALSQTEKALLDRQWDRDFSGMFAPLKKAAEVREGEQEPRRSEEPKKELEKDTKNKTEEDKYQSDSFTYTVEQDGTVTLFSCITSNPALMYGNLLPRVVRVVYRLIPANAQDGVYTLVRQQSENLAMDAFKNIKENKVRAYELATGIKKLKIEAWAEKIHKKDDQQAKNAQEPAAQQKVAQQKKETKSEPRVFVPWQEWRKMDQEEKKKFELALVPALVKITVLFIQGKREIEQVFWYAPAYDIQPVIIEGPSRLLNNKELRGKKHAEQQYHKINEQLQDFNERVLSKKIGKK